MRGALRTVAGVGLALGILASPGGYAAGQNPTPPSDAQPQTPPSSSPSPTFRAGVNFVRVDVIVSDKSGTLVQNLKPEDFEVTEQGKPQKVETFSLVKLDGGQMATGDQTPEPIHSEIDEQREAAKSDVRLFAIFLDDYHVKLESSLVARKQIAQFVDTQLGPSDMIGVMYPLETLSSVLMTRDHDAVMKGIEQFVGRKYNYKPMNSVEERYEYYPAEVVEQIRNEVSLSALRGLIIHMGGLKEGRKALILVSEGYSMLLPAALRAPVAVLGGAGNPLAQGAPQGDPVTESRAQTLSQFDMEMALRDVYEEANRYNVSIYAVDPRGLATNEFGIDMADVGQRADMQILTSTMDTLRTLALETDGRAIVNRNDITMGMKQIVKDTSGYYLLGYNSTFTAPDGKFHEIKVRVKRPGVDVRARRGYWALNREEAAAVVAPVNKPGPPKAVQDALNAATITPQARLVRTWLGTERGENGKTKMTFVWEPAPPVPGAPARGAEQPARMSVTAAGGDGDPYFRGRVPAAASGAPTASPAAAASGRPRASGGRVTFDVPPGKIELRLAVEGSNAELLDSETREITVPDLSAPQTSLSTPELFRARTARDLQQIKADPNPVPLAGREFVRADRLLVRVAAYGPGNTTPTLTVRLLNRSGQAMSDLPVTPPSSPGQSSQIEFALGGLAPGEYVIEIKAAGEGGDAQELVGFRVTG